MAEVEFVMQDEEGEDRKVVARIRRLPVAAEGELDNYFGRWQVSQDQQSFGGEFKFGTIKNVALSHGLKSLSYERVNKRGEVQLTEAKLNPGNVLGSLPDLRDDETGESIFNRLVKEVVAHKPNRWLGTHDDYQAVFRRYLPEDADKADPTEDSPTSESSPSSTTPGDFHLE